MSEKVSLDPGQKGSGGMVRADLIVSPIGELVTASVDVPPARGRAMHDILRLKDAAIAVTGQNISYVGPAKELSAHVTTDSKTIVIDASNKLVSPGLVDPHTHLIFDGNRANEFIMRCQGRTYAEIAGAGGGIVASMKATQNASRERLVDLGRHRVRRMLEHGTTTTETKTGYGLSQASEINMLECIYDLMDETDCSIVPTFMPAHAVPPGADREEYVREIIEHMLPAARSICDRRIAANARYADIPVFVDVFCDRGYFTLDDTKRIFDSALALNFKLKVHADEFVNLGATTLAAEYGAASADHLLNISDAEIALLSRSNTAAVLLPGTSFYLNLAEHAPARRMVDAGVAVALGSDFNPGSCHIFSLPMILGLACLHLKLTPEEALSALTVNAACAIGLGSRVGMLRPGYRADITIYDVAALEEVPYNIGWNPVSGVIRNGALVVADKKLR